MFGNKNNDQPGFMVTPVNSNPKSGNGSGVAVLILAALAIYAVVVSDDQRPNPLDVQDTGIPENIPLIP